MKRTTCPQCRKSVAFRDEHENKMGRCPHCKSRLRLAAAPGPAPARLQPRPSQPAAKPAPPAEAKAAPRRKKSNGCLIVAAVGLVLLVAAGVAGTLMLEPILAMVQGFPEPGKPPPYDYPISFHDSVASNAQPADDSLALSFVDPDGKAVDLKQYRGRKNVVLVVTRGYSGRVCLGCVTQTSRLISNYEEFARRDAEVLVVFPGPREHLGEFVQKSRDGPPAALPFPLLLDEDFAAVDRLGIRADLAKPSTYIVDKQGRVRFAYVGAHLSDRPSVKAMLEQLDAIATGEPTP